MRTRPRSPGAGGPPSIAAGWSGGPLARAIGRRRAQGGLFRGRALQKRLLGGERSPDGSWIGESVASRGPSPLGRAGRPSPPWANPASRPPAPAFPNVLLTRSLSYRNFAGEPFAVSASPQACERLAEKASVVAARQGLEAFRLATCAPRRSASCASATCCRSPRSPWRASGESSTWPWEGMRILFAWINEVEHVTWVQGHAGLLPAEEFAPPWRPPAGSSRPWARSPRLGYLASDPSRVGPGISFRVLAHLPALSLARRLGQAQGAMAALGIAFLPVTRMGRPGRPRPEAEPARFWMVFRGGLGGTPGSAYREFAATSNPCFAGKGDAAQIPGETSQKARG